MSLRAITSTFKIPLGWISEVCSSYGVSMLRRSRDGRSTVVLLYADNAGGWLILTYKGDSTAEADYIGAEDFGNDGLKAVNDWLDR